MTIQRITVLLLALAAMCFAAVAATTSEGGQWGKTRGKVAPPKFGVCNLAASGPNEGMSSLEQQTRSEYPVVFVAGDWTIAMDGLQLQHADLDLGYRVRDGRLQVYVRSAQSIRADPWRHHACKEMTPAHLRLYIERLYVHENRKNARPAGLTEAFIAKAKNSILPNPLILRGVSMQVDMGISADGYDMKETHGENPLFRLTDLPEDNPQNQYSFCFQKLKWKMMSGPFSRLTTKLEKYLSVLEGVLRGVLGNAIKCWLSQGQPGGLELFLGDARRAVTAIDKLKQCQALTESSTPRTVQLQHCIELLDREGFRVPSALRKVEPGMSMGQLNDLGSHIRDVIAAMGTDENTTKFSLQFKLQPERALEDLTSGMLPNISVEKSIGVNLNSKTLLRSIVSSAESANAFLAMTDDSLSLNAAFLRTLVSNWMLKNGVEGYDLAAVMSIISEAYITKLFESKLLANGVTAKIERTDSEENSVAELFVDHFEGRLDSRNNPVNVPLRLFLKHGQCAVSMATLVRLCRDDEACIRRRVRKNPGVFSMTAAQVMEYLEGSEVQAKGLSMVGVYEYMIRSMLTPDLWSDIAESLCSQQNCHVLMDMVDEFMREAPFLASLSLPRGPGRGLRFDKDRFVLETAAQYKGRLNLGKVLGLAVNAGSYLMKIAEEKNYDAASWMAVVDHLFSIDDLSSWTSSSYDGSEWYESSESGDDSDGEVYASPQGREPNGYDDVDNESIPDEYGGLDTHPLEDHPGRL